MTRKEEFKQRAMNFLADEHAEPIDLVDMLLQVEREVLGKVITHTQRYQQFIFAQGQSLEFEAGFRAAARVMEDWLNSQQQELT